MPKKKAVNVAYGGKLKGASHERGGIKVQGANIELEGDEFVVNKESAKKFEKELIAINNDPASVRKLKPLDNIAMARRGGKNTAYNPKTRKKKRVKHEATPYRRGGKFSKKYPGMCEK